VSQDPDGPGHRTFDEAESHGGDAKKGVKFATLASAKQVQKNQIAQRRGGNAVPQALES
jgi:hypothetical protein